MTKQTVVALTLTIAIWLGALAAVAATGAGSRPREPEASRAAIYPTAAPVDVNPCGSGACW